MGLALALVLSYLAGSFPTAVVVGKLFFKRDPRNEGSGNAGGTNAFRVFGWKAGLAVALVDLGKGYLAAAALSALAAGSAGAPPPLAREGAMLLCGLAAVAGHVWTVFAGFRGGKGVATAAGVLLAFQPWLGVATLVTWLIIAVFFRYSSLASILAAVFAPGYYLMGDALAWTVSADKALAMMAMGALLIWRHRENIRRLLAGTESRLGAKKP